MASSEFSLQFIFSQASNADLRTFKIVKIPEESGPSIELYRFHHPVTGLHIGTTTFQRLNLLTNVYETAGQIGWLSNHNATIVFGVEEVNMKELRKAKKANSKSQRFKAGNSEYKWKRVDNDIKKDLVCVDSRGKTVVTWTHDSSMLVVSRKVEAHLDRVATDGWIRRRPSYKGLGQPWRSVRSPCHQFLTAFTGHGSRCNNATEWCVWHSLDSRGASFESLSMW